MAVGTWSGDAGHRPEEMALNGGDSAAEWACKLSMSDINILDVCCGIEEICSNMYRFLAGHFSDNQTIAALWEKTAQEEDNHAEQFRLASRLHGIGMKSVKFDLYGVKLILNKIMTIYEHIQGRPPQIKEALKIAVKLERELEKYHMDLMVAFEDHNLSRLFAAMKAYDRGHIELLQRAHDSL